MTNHTLMAKPFIFLLLLSFPGFAFPKYQLEIEITSLRSNKGILMIQLFDADQHVINQVKGAISENKCITAFNDLKPGKYAVRYYHDENSSGKMETNLVGKPVEGYGFSNNVTGKFGPPPFEKWLFNLDSDKKIILKITY
jgi:uncharacterized protein (DUF2141 family)